MSEEKIGQFSIQCLSTLCEGCDEIKLTVEHLYAYDGIAQTFVFCENRSICKRICSLSDKENTD